MRKDKSLLKRVKDETEGNAKVTTVSQIAASLLTRLFHVKSRTQPCCSEFRLSSNGQSRCTRVINASDWLANDRPHAVVMYVVNDSYARTNCAPLIPQDTHTFIKMNN